MLFCLFQAESSEFCKHVTSLLWHGRITNETTWDKPVGTVANRPSNSRGSDRMHERRLTISAEYLSPSVQNTKEERQESLGSPVGFRVQDFNESPDDSEPRPPRSVSSSSPFRRNEQVQLQTHMQTAPTPPCAMRALSVPLPAVAADQKQRLTTPRRLGQLSASAVAATEPPEQGQDGMHTKQSEQEHAQNSSGSSGARLASHTPGITHATSAASPSQQA